MSSCVEDALGKLNWLVVWWWMHYGQTLLVGPLYTQPAAAVAAAPAPLLLLLLLRRIHQKANIRWEQWAHKGCVRIPALGIMTGTLASCEVNIVKSQLARAFCCDLYWWNDKLKLKLPGIFEALVRNELRLYLLLWCPRYWCLPACDINSQDFSQFPRVLLEAAKTVCSGSSSKDDVQIYVLKVESSWERVLSLAEASYHSQIVVRKYVSHGRLCSVWKCFFSRFHLKQTEVGYSYVLKRSSGTTNCNLNI